VTAPLRVLIVDDEPVARSGIKALLARDAEMTVVGECGDGRTAVEAIRELRPDLVLLDIQMPEMDGFEVIQTVGPDRMPPVVFVTAWDQFALRAFEVHALDYLLKPFDDERFTDALSRIKRAIRTGQVDQLAGRLAALLNDVPREERYLSRIVVRKTSGAVFVPVSEIDWIEAADYCARIHTHGKVHVIRETMQRLEQRLDPGRFFRVHRSGIVNLDRVREMQPAPHGDHVLVLQDGSKVRLSRSRKAALEERMGQPL
jgi:two-component system, LytTR family, response regulator